MRGAAGEFCWVDLAATDVVAAGAFYERLFGWKPREQDANGGRFTRLQLDGHDVGSMYQLRSVHRQQGVPSHWTPYVRVDDIESAARRAAACAGRVIVRPLDVDPVARIALIMDPVGALLGLWESLDGARPKSD